MPPSRYQDWASFEYRPGPAGVPAAFGADLSPASLLGAYRRGLVPLPARDDYFRTLNEVRYADLVAEGAIALVGADRADPYQVAWWSPDPRPVIGPGQVHLGRNVRKRLRRDGLVTTADTAFTAVAEACRAGREPQWLTDELLGSLTELHAAGWAHSVEVWLDGTLAGGAMAVGIGPVMSGDSLFGRHPGAGAVAVAELGARLTVPGAVIDAQWDSPFLRSLGAQDVPRDKFLALLDGPLEPLPLRRGERPALDLLE